MKSTLIYNELWKDICKGDVKPNKPSNVAPLAKWELKDGKALALIKSSVNEEIYVHIENASDAWSAWKTFKYLFGTQLETKRVDLQLKLLQQKLTRGGDLLEYISILKNIRWDIFKAGFTNVDENLMTTILIAGFSSSYKHLLETLQLKRKLEKIKFYYLSELLAQHDKTFGKKKHIGEDVFFTEASTGKPSTESSIGRGAQFSNKGYGNKYQSTYRG